MGRIQIVLPDDVEDKLRKDISKQGYKKGMLSQRIQELIEASLDDAGEQ